MKIAIIGSGISGNLLAYHLHRDHDITLFEANNYVGGHSHTHDISMDDGDHVVDTGFIVLNYKTYPHFTRLLDELGVETQLSDMGFSVKCEVSGLEYNGKNLDTLFAQRRNLLSPRFYRMIGDILRFNKQASKFALESDNTLSLGEYLHDNGYSRPFIDHYIIPMGSAIWSSSYEQMMRFPAQLFIRFFHNHGLLSVNDRPDWYVIRGGSRTYVDALTRSFRDRIRLNAPASRVIRKPTHVEIVSSAMGAEKFDYVFFACHANQVLAMLDQPDWRELDILNAFPYQDNEVILHTDTRVLPRRRRAWAAWNYHRHDDPKRPVSVTYNMNILQGIDSRHTFCVTLNNTAAIDPDKILRRLHYAHPLFTENSLQAQRRHRELNGNQRCYYAGAYWRNGFHEDGVVSALLTLEDFREQLTYEQQTVRRAG